MLPTSVAGAAVDRPRSPLGPRSPRGSHRPAVQLARREHTPCSRAVEAAVHVAGIELAAYEQHAVYGPPVEVEERPGDRPAFQDRQRLGHRLEGGHAVTGAVTSQGVPRKDTG